MFYRKLDEAPMAALKDKMAACLERFRFHHQTFLWCQILNKRRRTVFRNWWHHHHQRLKYEIWNYDQCLPGVEYKQQQVWFRFAQQTTGRRFKAPHIARPSPSTSCVGHDRISSSVNNIKAKFSDPVWSEPKITFVHFRIILWVNKVAVFRRFLRSYRWRQCLVPESAHTGNECLACCFASQLISDESLDETREVLWRYICEWNRESYWAAAGDDVYLVRRVSLSGFILIVMVTTRTCDTLYWLTNIIHVISGTVQTGSIIKGGTLPLYGGHFGTC